MRAEPFSGVAMPLNVKRSGLSIEASEGRVELLADISGSGAVALIAILAPAICTRISTGELTPSAGLTAGKRLPGILMNLFRMLR